MLVSVECHTPMSLRIAESRADAADSVRTQHHDRSQAIITEEHRHKLRAHAAVHGCVCMGPEISGEVRIQKIGARPTSSGEAAQTQAHKATHD